jgi:hypothetical protein
MTETIARAEQERPEANLWTNLRDRERRVLAALEDYFSCASELARSRTETLHGRYREKVNVLAQISTTEARIQEIGHLQNAVRDEAAGYLVERNEKRVSELQNRHASLSEEREAARKELAGLRGKLRGFSGVPDTAESFEGTNAAQRGALVKETDRLRRGIDARLRDGRKAIGCA